MIQINVKCRALKELTHILIKTILISSLAVPLILAECKKDDGPPKSKSLLQSVTLQNDVELLYKATLNNVNTAVLNVSRDGKLILSENISDVAKSGPDKQFVYRYSDNPDFIQGKFKFEIIGDNISKTSEVEIPDYAPGFNTNGIVFDFVENTSNKISLGKPVDKNPEDNPITLTGIVSADDKTSVTYTTTSTGIDVDVKSKPGASGPYQLEFDFTKGDGSLDKLVLGGQIMKDVRKNFFVQPNDSTLNWYGSGDVDNNNVVNSLDLAKLVDILNGYTNPSDRRLMDRADVNGDSLVNDSDRQLLEDYLNGVVSHLPGYWNVDDYDEKLDWAKKMFAIDKTNEQNLGENACVIYSLQTIINFSGISSPTDIERLKTIYPFNFENNGRFNIPMQELDMTHYNPLNGQPTDGHTVVTMIMGNKINYPNTKMVEPQRDDFTIKIEGGLYGSDSKLSATFMPMTGYVGAYGGTKYFEFSMSNDISTLTYVSPNLTTQRGSK